MRGEHRRRRLSCSFQGALLLLLIALLARLRLWLQPRSKGSEQFHGGGATKLPSSQPPHDSSPIHSGLSQISSGEIRIADHHESHHESLRFDLTRSNSLPVVLLKRLFQAGNGHVRIDTGSVDEIQQTEQRIAGLMSGFGPSQCEKDPPTWISDSANKRYTPISSTLTTPEGIFSSTTWTILDFVYEPVPNDVVYVADTPLCAKFPATCSERLQPLLNKRLPRQFTGLFAVDCALVDGGSQNLDAPGLIVTKDVSFSHAWHNRIELGNTNGRAFIHLENVAVAVSYYPGAVQHTIMDEIPRVVYFDAFLPRHIPILVGDEPLERKFIEFFKANGVLHPERKFIGLQRGAMYTTGRAFDVGVFEDCRKFRQTADPEWHLSLSSGSTDFHCENDNSFGPLSIIRRRLPSRVSPEKRILVIDRSDAGSRQISNHAELLEALKQEFPLENGWSVVSFISRDHDLNSTVSLFGSSLVIIGPHGAGLSNIIFCKTRTVMVEVAYDGHEGMSWPQNFFASYAAKLGMLVGATLGSGNYNSAIRADIRNLLSVLRPLVDEARRYHQLS